MKFKKKVLKFLAWIIVVVFAVILKYFHFFR